MRVPGHQLDAAEAYLAVLDGFAQVSPPGAQFTYNNGGYVVLALLAERAAGRSYHDLVDELVVQRAGLADTSFVRSDAMPANLATGYLDRDGLRTNALHLPVLGVGDGGIVSTTADMAAFWTALYDGSIVSAEHVEPMTRPHSDAPRTPPPLRARVLARRHGTDSLPGGLRRRRVVPLDARPDDGHDADHDLEHVGGRVGPAPRP